MTRAMSSLSKKIVKKTPGIRTLAAHLSSLHQQLESQGRQLEQMQAQVDQIAGYDNRVDRLRHLVDQVEHYQPTYGIVGVVDTPQRGESRERCLAIESALRPVPGKRILDVGSSLGYFSFYFADRGADVEGWESNAKNAEVARLIGEINGIQAAFKTKELSTDTVQTIAPGRFDAALVLSVFHHVIRFNGLEYAQRLVKDLLARTPVLIVELAKKGEDPSLPWDESQPDDELAIFALVEDQVEIKKFGEFGNHLSDKTRPLYSVRAKKQVTVNAHIYHYDHTSAEAYKDSPVAHRHVNRRYYFAETFVIKDYSFDEKSKKENVAQILNEITFFLDVQCGKKKIRHAPRMLDFEITYPKGAKLVLERIHGELLSDLEGSILQKQIVGIVQDVLETIADLQAARLHHNDIRSWNIMVEGRTTHVIDYGLTSPQPIDDDIVSLLWVAHGLLKGGERESYQVSKKGLPSRAAFEGSPLKPFYDAISGGERSASQLLKVI